MTENVYIQTFEEFEIITSPDHHLMVNQLSSAVYLVGDSDSDSDGDLKGNNTEWDQLFEDFARSAAFTASNCESIQSGHRLSGVVQSKEYETRDVHHVDFDQSSSRKEQNGCHSNFDQSPSYQVQDYGIANLDQSPPYIARSLSQSDSECISGSQERSLTSSSRFIEQESSSATPVASRESSYGNQLGSSPCDMDSERREFFEDSDLQDSSGDLQGSSGSTLEIDNHSYRELEGGTPYPTVEPELSDDVEEIERGTSPVKGKHSYWEYLKLMRHHSSGFSEKRKRSD